MGGGNSREGRILNRCVAVATAEPKAVDMVLMTEGNGLLAGNTNIGCVPGAIDAGDDDKQNGNNDQRAHDTGTGKHFHAWMKNLRHLRSHPFVAIIRHPGNNGHVRASESGEAMVQGVGKPEKGTGLITRTTPAKPAGPLVVPRLKTGSIYILTVNLSRIAGEP